MRSAYRLATRLTTLGVEMVEVPQNFRHLSEASKDFEAKVLSKRMPHDGNKLVRWTVDNAAIDHDKNGKFRPAKPASQRFHRHVRNEAGACTVSDLSLPG